MKPLEQLAQSIIDRADTRPTPTEFDRAKAKARREYERQQQVEALDKQFCDSIGKGHFERSKLETFRCDKSPDRQRKCLKTVQAWVDNFSALSPSNLILYGPVGTGKDHLAIGAIRAVMPVLRGRVKFINGRNMAGDLRDLIDSQETEASFIKKLVYPQILLISDPVAVKGQMKDHQADMIYRIVFERTEARVATVMTVNVNNDDEADQQFGAPTWDRLRGNAYKVFCQWETYRKPKVEV